MVKNIEFIERKNKPLYEIEIVIDDIIDNVYENMINYYKQKNINDIILIDKRLDTQRKMLIDFTYLQKGDYFLDTNKYICAYHLKSFQHLFGYLCRSEKDFIIIKGKIRSYKLYLNDYHIFFIEKKSKKQKENEKMRNMFKNILDNKIKIKKN